MRNEFDMYLCKTYPKLFADRDKPMTQTAMCWGFSHGDGWFNIINALCANIQHHIDWTEQQYQHNTVYNEMVTDAFEGKWEKFNEYYKGRINIEDYKKEVLEGKLRKVRTPCPQVTVDQVKEKFGTLRFYYTGGDEYVAGLVSMAESMTAVTCEVCGNAGRRRGTGWIQTLCDEHSKENDYSVGRFVEVGETVSVFTKEGFDDASVVSVIDEHQGVLEILDKKNTTLKVKPLIIGGVDLGSYEPVTD